MVGSRSLTRPGEISALLGPPVAEAGDVGVEGMARIELGVEASVYLESRNRTWWLGDVSMHHTDPHLHEVPVRVDSSQRFVRRHRPAVRRK